MFMNLRGTFARLQTSGVLLLNPITRLNNLKTYSLRAFSIIAPILWNDLPIDIRSTDDVNKFKSKLKTFVFKRVYELS